VRSLLPPYLASMIADLRAWCIFRRFLNHGPPKLR
jgi:hypothetical protein